MILEQPLGTQGIEREPGRLARVVARTHGGTRLCGVEEAGEYVRDGAATQGTQGGVEHPRLAATRRGQHQSRLFLDLAAHGRGQRFVRIEKPARRIGDVRVRGS